MQYQTTLLEPIRLRLVAELPNGIEVIHLPQSPAEANNNQSFAKRVIIAFGSTEYVDRLGVSDKSFMSNNSFVTQNGFVLVYLLVESRLLRGNDGIFQLISEVKRALVGHDVPSYGRLHLGKIIPNPDAPDGINSYFIEVYCKERLVADLPDETGQLITAINGVTAPETTPSDGLLVANSDASYNVTITENKILPDIAVIDFAGTTHVWPSVKNVNFAAGDLPDFDTGSGGDPVTVDVNGTEVEADPGETVTVNVTRGGAPIGDVTVTGSTIDVVIPACEDATVTVNTEAFATVAAGGSLNIPVVNQSNGAVGAIGSGKVTIRTADLSINGTDVDTLLPETNKALTVTLNGAPTTPTYTDGTINVSTGSGSGIAYVDFTAAQTQNYEVGFQDVGANFLAGRYNRTQPSDPATYAQLDPADPTGKTLLSNNIHGNKHRFTDAAGNAGPFTYAFNSGTIIAFQDHLHGGWWAGNWTNRNFTQCLSDIAALNITGIGSGWLCLDQDMVSTIQKINGSSASNLLFDCGVTIATYWTGLTRPDLVTQGYRVQGVTFSISTQAKTTNSRWIAFKFFD